MAVPYDGWNRLKRGKPTDGAGDQPPRVWRFRPQHKGRVSHETTIGIPSALNYQGKWSVSYNNRFTIIRALECCYFQSTDSPTFEAALQRVINHHQRYRITTVNLAPVDDQQHSEPVKTEIDDKLQQAINQIRRRL
jgi:hypothetical protein